MLEFVGWFMYNPLFMCISFWFYGLRCGNVIVIRLDLRLKWSLFVCSHAYLLILRVVGMWQLRWCYFCLICCLGYLYILDVHVPCEAGNRYKILWEIYIVSVIIDMACLVIIVVDEYSFNLLFVLAKNENRCSENETSTLMPLDVSWCFCCILSTVVYW